jgi:hypothetical protein
VRGHPNGLRSAKPIRAGAKCPGSAYQYLFSLELPDTAEQLVSLITDCALPHMKEECLTSNNGSRIYGVIVASETQQPELIARASSVRWIHLPGRVTRSHADSFALFATHTVRAAHFTDEIRLAYSLFRAVR